MNSASLPALWNQCVDLVKDRINSRSLWEALEMTRPVTIENETLIVGLDPTNYGRASTIQQGAFHNAIARAIEEVFRQPLEMKLIEGTALADWEYAKQRDARVAAMRQTTIEKRVSDDRQSDSWDGLYEQIARLYQQTPYRALPQGKARYANEALYHLVEAMDELYPSEPTEASERSLARVLDRIANASEIPAAVLAFELERLRAWRRSASEATEPGTGGS